MTPKTKTESERERRGRELEERFAGGGSKPARERELAEHASPSSRRPPHRDAKEHERQITRAHMVGPTDPTGTFEQQAAEGIREVTGHAPLSRESEERLSAALEARRANEARLVRRAHDAIAADGTTPHPARPGARASGPGWSELIARAQAEQSRVSIGEQDPAPFDDPDQERPRPGETVIARGDRIGGRGI